ncbi:hypothetical protein [Sphingomonas sp. LM7]|uniref:hypothetical protein n=1 Tax=Sphingomonas sp. LM7 TaxID=1938607 RepID=UPI000983D801|nr:hypothetical protein [Sphingomonas sp. LM7]AQR73297.1 hypothetical protein BXU08_06230 [Sphingomonas sp. LM7]
MSMSELDISTDSAGKISFPDCPIMHFRAGRRLIQFVAQGVHVDGVGFANNFYAVRCASNDAISCRRYSDDMWHPLSPDDAGTLREICEWAVESRTLVFAGFEAHSGQWQEYTVPAFSLTGSVEEARPS